ncbi:hypothetical protein BC941DRAFT_442533 [Chlamydoabsidia padenii]|nr:hypothetical protein BC941DRAFT_442533 [Chlamydoabsidia padenii]
MEQRLGLDDAKGWGKVLAVGDDGIRGTVLRNILYDENGDPILPTKAGTRQVVIIDGRTTTLKNGIPTPFPVDNGHTRTVLALRNGMVTLPLTGADEFTKLLPGVTETIAVFDDVTYTLSPDHSIPAQIMRTVVVEEILDRPPSKTAAAVAAAASEFRSSVMLVQEDEGTLKIPTTSTLPLPMFIVSAPVASPPPMSDLVITPSIVPTSTLLPKLLSSLLHPVATKSNNFPATTTTHCPTKLILNSKRASEGCYSLTGLDIVDSDMRQVDTQGYWTDQECHEYCEKSPKLAPSFASSWYYGLTVASDNTTTTCRCITDLVGSHPSTHCHVAPTSLQQRPWHFGVMSSSDTPAVYLYQATYRCLSPSLMKRRQQTIDLDPTSCRATELKSKRESEGCYPYLAPKVSLSHTRHDWTAATCYSFCVESGRVPTRATWYYGLMTFAFGSSDKTCLCMLEMGAIPTDTSNCTNLSSDGINDEKVGVVNPDDLSTGAIYAYQVSYQCPTCTHPTTIGDPQETEGCYGLSDYADIAIKKVTRDVDDGVYTSKECFDICLESGLIKPGEPWWYGISRTDPSDDWLVNTTSCRCSTRAPATTPGRCEHGIGLVNDRMFYRVNSGVYVYKVSYQC